MTHPTYRDFNPVHHPSYIDFFEQVLADTTDPATMSTQVGEAVRRGRVVSPPVPHRQRLPRRASVLRVVLGRARPAARRQGDHRRRRSADRSPTRLHAGVDDGRCVRDRQRCRRSLADDHAPPRARAAGGRRAVSKRTVPYSLTGLRRAARLGDVASATLQRALQPESQRSASRTASRAFPRASSCRRIRRKLGANFETAWARRRPAKAARRVITNGPLRLVVHGLARPEIYGVDRLEDLRLRDEPPPLIFAPTHHSHLDTPLSIISIPEPWRSKLVVAAAADFFFDVRWKGMHRRAVAERDPDRSRGHRPQDQRPTEAVDRGRLEPGDLPGGWSLARRLGPGVQGRRRVPRRHAPVPQSCRCSSTAPARSTARA